MNELNPETMCDVIPGTLRRSVIADEEDVPMERRFFEGWKRFPGANLYTVFIQGADLLTPSLFF